MNLPILYMLWIFVACGVCLCVAGLCEGAAISMLKRVSRPNNEFKIISGGIATLKYFCIFNRSGDHIFDAKGSSNAWNSDGKGVSGPVALYVCQVEGLTPKREKIVKTENITITR